MKLREKIEKKGKAITTFGPRDRLAVQQKLNRDFEDLVFKLGITALEFRRFLEFQGYEWARFTEWDCLECQLVFKSEELYEEYMAKDEYGTWDISHFKEEGWMLSQCGSTKYGVDAWEGDCWEIYIEDVETGLYFNHLGPAVKTIDPSKFGDIHGKPIINHLYCGDAHWRKVAALADDWFGYGLGRGIEWGIWSMVRGKQHEILMEEKKEEVVLEID